MVDNFFQYFWKPVFGHQAAAKNLWQAVKKGRVPHALLFSGPSSIGKRTMAFAFATQLFCNNKNSSIGSAKVTTAEQIKLLSSGNHPDLHLVFKETDKKDLSVESIRLMCRELQLKPYFGGCKIAIIDNAHQMNSAAYNSLLMTLEEPFPDSYIILVSHAPQRIPSTILSRCQSLHFSALSESNMCSLLKSVAGSKITEAELGKVAALCSGSLELLDLEQFVSPTTLNILDPDRLGEYLQELAKKISRIDKQLENLCKTANSSNVSYSGAVSLSTELTAEKEDSNLVWSLLISRLQQNMKSAQPKHVSTWASLLESAVDKEKLTRERNLSHQLQLTSMLVDIAAFSSDS